MRAAISARAEELGHLDAGGLVREADGHVDRILISQDVCHDSQLTRYDGNGYTYLTRSFLPRLREAGVSEAEIETMTVANPRRLLTVG